MEVIVNIILSVTLVINLQKVCAWSVTMNNSDPCIFPRSLGFLRQREVGYKLAQGELPICDHYFYDGWYEMPEYVTASTDETCGTDWNWYRLGSLPTDDQMIQSVSYCLNVGGGVCGLTKTLRVKKCSDKKYVFELFAVESCPQAYCIERLNGTNKPDDVAPDISDIFPRITSSVGRDSNNLSELQFFCNFTVASSKSAYFFIVEWAISTGHSLTDKLWESPPIPYGNNFSAFMHSTALKERHLRNTTYWRLGLDIACSARAMKSLNGSLSQPRVSPSHFFGIEILDKHVFMNATSNSFVNMRLTAPFGCQHWETECSIDLTMYIPQNTENCRPASLGQIDQTDRVPNRCGVKFLSSDIDKVKRIKIMSLLGHSTEFRSWRYILMFGTQKRYGAHPLFQNYVPESIEVNVVTDMSKIAGKWCSSQGDPRISTFDSMRYSNELFGTFLLYKNINHNVQVQVKTTFCKPRITTVSCNCGVAVNAGRDVFILDKCPDGNTNWNPVFRCKDRILARKVTRDSSGTKFVVTLPTGTEVHITLGLSLINIISIKASLADWENTIGICGKFNGKSSDDIFVRPGSSATDPNRSWMVLANENLFSHQNDNNLIPWSAERMQCHCPAVFEGGGGPENELECRPDMAKTCNDSRLQPAFTDRCIIGRKKRNVHGVFVHRGLDLHFSTNYNFVSAITENRNPRDLKPKRDVYDYESAKADCLKILNTTAFQKCSQVPIIDSAQFVEECILDAMDSNSMEWTQSYLSAFKDRCVYEVKLNQPLTVQDLAGTNSSVNSSSDETGTPIEVPSSPAFSPDFLDGLEAIVCLNDCSNSGRCEHGECVCNTGFIGPDCSVDSSKPPLMDGIPDNGVCDLQYRVCAKTSVYGRNFVSTPNLSCGLVPFTVDSTQKIVTGTRTLSTAKLETFVEVSCPLKQSRKKRDAASGSIDYIATGYRVSVSNDRTAFSEEDIIVIFDSECVNCSKSDGKVICIRKPGYCVKEGRCYKSGDEYGCYFCAGDSGNVLEWMSGPDCPIPATTQTPSNKIWIIPAVVAPTVVVIVAGVIIFCVCKWLKKKKAAENEHLYDDIQTRGNNVNENVYNNMVYEN